MIGVATKLKLVLILCIIIWFCFVVNLDRENNESRDISMFSDWKNKQQTPKPLQSSKLSHQLTNSILRVDEPKRC